MHAHAAVALVALAPLLVKGHVAAFAKGMYCKGGPDGNNDNNQTPISPLYQLSKADWWFQHDRGCDTAPPADGDILELPAGGTFDVELAHNQAFTTLSWAGKFSSAWPDGKDHPDYWNTAGDNGCLEDGALHAHNVSDTAGTAWAISYQSQQSAVTLENLVVFTTKSGTPWKRETTYEVPAAMPACPDGICHCMWLWAASICGQQNIYVQPFKCTVTGAKSTTPLAAPQPPKYCEGPAATDSCVSGAKQPIILNQAEGNNIKDLPWQTWGGVYNYGYSKGFGFSDGAQNDIFAGEASSPADSSSSSTGNAVASSTAGSSSSSTSEDTQGVNKNINVVSDTLNGESQSNGRASTADTTSPAAASSGASGEAAAVSVSPQGRCRVRGARARRMAF